LILFYLGIFKGRVWRVDAFCEGGS
jgi:hypothetical protein